MQIQTIIDTLERAAPLSLQEPWDNSGLQVGRLSGTCNGVVVALDPTEAVVDHAIEQGASLIVTHHPLLFKGLTTIDTEVAVGRVVEKLIKNNITLYALHTPADSTVGGLNDRLAKALGLVETQPLEDSGIGRIGNLPQPMSMDRLVGLVGSSLNIKSSMAFAQARSEVGRVAVCSGSGTSCIEAAAAKGADVLVCGDVKHHDFQRALERQIGIIDATHYATEVGFVDWVGELLADIQKKNTIFALHLYRNNFISYYTR